MSPRTDAALGDRTWVDVESAAPRPLLAVPVGSLEQHGPHLPLDTDSRVAGALADGLAARRGDVVVAPALAFGSSGEHADFPGTLSIGNDVLEAVLVELVRSADAFRGVVLVNGHGGNSIPLRRAVDVGRAEGRAVLGWSWSVPGGDAHAGRTETSLLLALAPDLVRADRAAAGDTTPVADLLGRLHADGVRAVSPNGVLGDPAGASADEGEAVLADLVDRLAAAVADTFGPPV